MSTVNKKRNTFIIIFAVAVIIGIVVFFNIQQGIKVYNAINPNGRINDANNRDKIANVKALLSAIQMYQSNNQGAYPRGLSRLSSPLISSSAYGYSITGSTIGVPNCVTGSGTIPNATVSISSSCVHLTSGTPLYTELSNYVSSLPTGNYYVAENNSGTKVVVFVTGMKQGVTSNTKGYPIAWAYK